MLFHRTLLIGTIVVLAVVVFSSNETIAAEWERLSGEQLKMLFDNKTHKGSDFSIFYDGNGERILHWNGSNYPATYHVRDDVYSYSSGGTFKTGEIWKDPGKENEYRICQNEMCWGMKVFEGNVDDLK